MLRTPLLLALLLAGCSKGAEADLQYISDGRSIGAEWALVNEQASQGKLTATFTNTMRADLRKQLQTTRSSLTSPDSRYALEMDALLHQPPDAAPEELRAHSDKLKQIEDGLESA